MSLLSLGLRWQGAPSPPRRFAVQPSAPLLQVQDVFLENIIPAFGGLVGVMMFASPLKAVLRARREKTLGVRRPQCVHQALPVGHTYSGRPCTPCTPCRPQQTSCCFLPAGLQPHAAAGHLLQLRGVDRCAGSALAAVHHAWPAGIRAAAAARQLAPGLSTAATVRLQVIPLW